MRRSCIIAALALVLVACERAQGSPCADPIEPSKAPEQTPVSGEAELQLTAAGSDFVLGKLARYRVAARVLSRERYYWGWQSRLSPLDLALGWGYMSDPRVDRFIDWRQGGRWYFYTWSGESPYRKEDIRSESSNVHIVPGSSNLRRALLQIERGDVVELSGALIYARRAQRQTVEWRSSLSRTDSGGGACELMLVDRLLHRGFEYQ